MSRLASAFRLTGLGFYVGICITLGAYGGLWLDEKLNTSPLFIISGILLGLAVAAYGVYQMIKPLINNRNDREDD